MKKALIITYYWPPSGGAGVQRWLKFVKYLRDYGWEPVVYTPENPESPEYDPSLESDIPQGVQVIRQPIWEPYTFYKHFLGQKKEEKIQSAFLSEKKKNPLAEKIAVWVRGNLFIPDARKFFIKPSARFLLKYLKQNPVDLIISTGPPHSMHMIALKIAETFSLPWLADFRDPWTGIDFYKDLMLSHRANAKHHQMEMAVLQKASTITVISPSMADEFRAIFKRDYEVVTNGFDETDNTIGSSVHMDQKFSIAHIGTLTPSRNPIVLWKALHDMVIEDDQFRKDLEIKLVGKVDHLVISSLEDHGLKEYVKRQDYLPHKEVILIQQTSQILLLLINDTPNSKSILTGKLFEYLASGRPVICIGPPEGDAARILTQTNAGQTSGFDDLESLKLNIRNNYKLFQEGILEINPREVEKYSRKNLTDKMARIMDRTIIRSD